VLGHARSGIAETPKTTLTAFPSLSPSVNESDISRAWGVQQSVASQLGGRSHSVGTDKSSELYE
jgi:hypothetical protein